jgi:hypothetical protein
MGHLLQVTKYNLDVVGTQWVWLYDDGSHVREEYLFYHEEKEQAPQLGKWPYGKEDLKHQLRKEYVNGGMYSIFPGKWCDIIIVNMNGKTDNKDDEFMDSLYEESECVLKNLFDNTSQFF